MLLLGRMPCLPPLKVRFGKLRAAARLLHDLLPRPVVLLLPESGLWLLSVALRPWVLLLRPLLPLLLRRGLLLGLLPPSLRL